MKRLFEMWFYWTIRYPFCGITVAIILSLSLVAGVAGVTIITYNKVGFIPAVLTLWVLWYVTNLVDQLYLRPMALSVVKDQLAKDADQLNLKTV